MSSYEFWLKNVEDSIFNHFHMMIFSRLRAKQLQTGIRAVWLHHPLAGCLQWDGWSLQGGLGSSRIHAGEFQGLRISRETLSTPAFEIDLRWFKCEIRHISTNFQSCKWGKMVIPCGQCVSMIPRCLGQMGSYCIALGSSFESGSGSLLQLWLALIDTCIPQRSTTNWEIVIVTQEWMLADVGTI